MSLEYKVAKTLWRSRVSAKLRPDLDSACLKTPITTFCLTILMDLNFSQFFGFKFRVIFPYFKRGQLPGSRHSAVVIIAPAGKSPNDQHLARMSHSKIQYVLGIGSLSFQGQLPEDAVSCQDHPRCGQFFAIALGAAKRDTKGENKWTNCRHFPLQACNEEQNRRITDHNMHLTGYFSFLVHFVLNQLFF